MSKIFDFKTVLLSHTMRLNAQLKELAEVLKITPIDMTKRRYLQLKVKRAQQAIAELEEVANSEPQ